MTKGESNMTKEEMRNLNEEEIEKLIVDEFGKMIGNPGSVSSNTEMLENIMEECKLRGKTVPHYLDSAMNRAGIIGHIIKKAGLE